MGKERKQIGFIPSFKYEIVHYVSLAGTKSFLENVLTTTEGALMASVLQRQADHLYGDDELCRRLFTLGVFVHFRT